MKNQAKTKTQRATERTVMAKARDNARAQVAAETRKAHNPLTRDRLERAIKNLEDAEKLMYTIKETAKDTKDFPLAGSMAHFLENTSEIVNGLTELQEMETQP